MRPLLFLNVIALVMALASSAKAASIAVGSETFLVETFPIAAAITDTSPLPLDLTVDARSGNTIYMVPEFDKRIYSVARTASAGTTLTTIEIQAPGSPLFRNTLFGLDAGSFFSFAQERITSTSDGSVWVSQGGNTFYDGLKNNWSRIMRRKLDTTWEAYTLPVDSAAAMGFVIVGGAGSGNDRLVVASYGANSLYTTTVRSWHEGETTATRYPPVDSRWALLRAFGGGPLGSFPAHVISLRDGRLAGTLYFNSSFFLYSFRTAAFTDIPLAAPPPGTTAGSSGPWQLRQHPDGNIWITEDYAQRVTKYDLATGAQTVYDLSASLGTGEGPHSLTFDGTDVYITTYTSGAGGDLESASRLVKITNSGTITVGDAFSTINLGGGLTGIERDSEGKLWVCLFQQRAIARLTRQ